MTNHITIMTILRSRSYIKSGSIPFLGCREVSVSINEVEQVGPFDIKSMFFGSSILVCILQ